MLSSRENLTALMDLSGTGEVSVHQCAPLDKLILDLDSSRNTTYGADQGSAYNRCFECPDVHRDYHPLLLFTRHGDLERAMPRRGNHISVKFRRRTWQATACSLRMRSKTHRRLDFMAISWDLYRYACHGRFRL